ncbi:MAG: hypothetical protein GF400_02165 [Candidatus Eisenbacteria bacterium]|nr:hypothetical protein [Candidatus Eisenbacteria bacterium]
MKVLLTAGVCACALVACLWLAGPGDVAAQTPGATAAAKEPAGAATSQKEPDDTKDAGAARAKSEGGEAGRETEEEPGEPAGETGKGPAVPGGIRAIMAGRCVSCHGANGAAGLDLSEDRLAASLIDVVSTEVDSLALVEPGDPDASYLVIKVRGDEGMIGRMMPLGGKPLPDEDIDELVTWIAGLAPPDSSARDAQEAPGNGDAAGESQSVNDGE